MPKAPRFGSVLARIREERGFATPHAFYKRRDGRRNLKLTFRSYLDLEQGVSLPRRERLEAIVLALGLGEHSREARELVEAYFESLGLKPLMRFLQGAPPAAQPEMALGQMAARHAVSEKSVHLTVAQWKLRADDFEAHACHMYLVNTPGGAAIHELPGPTGLSKPAVERAVKALAAAGMAKISGGRVRSAFEKTLVKAPPKLPALVGLLAALDRHRERLTQHGKPVHQAAITLRLAEPSVAHFKRYFDEFADTAALYSTWDLPNSAIYTLRAQIFRVFPQSR